MPLEAAAHDAPPLPSPDAMSLVEDKDIVIVGSAIDSEEKTDSIRTSPAVANESCSCSAVGDHEHSIPSPSSALPSATPSVSDFFDPNLDVDASWFGAYFHS